VIFKPFSDPEKSEVVPAFHAPPYGAEKLECPLSVIGVQKLPTQIEQIIGIATSDNRWLAQKLINNLDRTTPAARTWLTGRL